MIVLDIRLCVNQIIDSCNIRSLTLLCILVGRISVRRYVLILLFLFKVYHCFIVIVSNGYVLFDIRVQMYIKYIGISSDINFVDLTLHL